MNSDNLVAEDGQVRVELGAVHGDGKLGSVAVFFSSDLHVSSFDENVVGVEISVMVGVIVRREDQGSFHIDEGKFRTDIDVEEQVKSLGNVDSLAILWRKVIAPSLILGPSADVADNLTLGSNKTKAFDVNIKSGLIRSVRLVRSGTSNCVFSLLVNHTLSVIDHDRSSCTRREASSVELNLLATEDGGEASAHASKNRGKC